MTPPAAPTPAQAAALRLVEGPDPDMPGEWLRMLPGSAAALRRAVQRELRLADRRDLYDSVLLEQLAGAARRQTRCRLHPAVGAALHAMAAAFPDSQIAMLLLGNRFTIDSEDRLRDSRATAAVPS